MKKLMILICMMGSIQGIFSQEFSGAESYGTEYDEYLYDFTVLEGDAYQLIKQELFTYPETVYASMLHGLDIRVNPLYLGNEYSNLKLTLDNYGNVYLTGIYTQKIISDTSYLFVSKLNSEGKNIWTKLYEKQSDSIKIYNDLENFIYVHDRHILYKLDYSGNLIWAKNHNGNIKLYNNHFYKFVSKNIYESFFSGQVCDSIIMCKLDTSGNQIFQKTINTSTEDNTMISSNCYVNIIDDRIFISNSYWGEINVDPSNCDYMFENNRTTYWGDKWGDVPVFNNYLAIYDTIGSLILANSKPNYPRLDYVCIDSVGSLYFSGYLGSKTDFDLKTNDSIIINKSENQISFIAKYSNNLDFYWCRGLTGLIKYIGINHYSVGGEERLDIAGEFEGTINLNLERPKDITFTSEGKDLFFAKYIYLNDNISPTNVRNTLYKDSFVIYPNPSKGILTIEGNYTDLQVEIFDLSGTLKYSNYFNTILSKKTLDLSQLNNGYYLIKMTIDNNIYTKKLLIYK